MLKYFLHRLPKPSEDLKIIITVPVKNEENYIIDLLQSLTKQKTNDYSSFPSNLFEVLILCNHCTDHSYEQCISFVNSHPEIAIHVYSTYDPLINNVGSARKLLMDIAYERLYNRNGFITITDADCVADTFWLYSIYNYYEKPVQLVCGRILYDTVGLSDIESSLLFAKNRYQDLLSYYESKLFPDSDDPWPRHNQNSGPNMSIRKEMYFKVGGIPATSFLEDIALFERVQKYSGMVRHCNETKIITSTRKISSVAQGFSSELHAWSQLTSIYNQYLVSGKEEIYKKYKVWQFIKEKYRYFTSYNLKVIANELFMKYELVVYIYGSSISYRDMIITLDHYLSEN